MTEPTSTSVPAGATASSGGQSVPPRRPGAGSASILSRWGSRGTAIVLGIGALVMVLIGATIGLALGPSSPQTVSVSAQGQDVVNTGFARDMVVHHTQGVTMAHLAELNSTNHEVQIVAYDIEYTQTSQIGTMNGWLGMWDVPLLTSATPMSWMGSTGMADMAGMVAATTAGTSSRLSDGAIMPGMATNAEMAKLQGLKGEASDIFFLQLMIRHHEGGAAMMKYAANHALSPVVQNFSSKMLEAQTSEIGVMTGMLTERGAKPLAFTPPTG